LALRPIATAVEPVAETSEPIATVLKLFALALRPTATASPSAVPFVFAPAVTSIPIATLFIAVFSAFALRPKATPPR